MSAPAQGEVYWITRSPVEDKEREDGVLGVSSVAVSLAAPRTPRVEPSMPGICALPAVNAICNPAVWPLVMFLFSNVCCNSQFLFFLLPSANHGSLFYKWPQFIYMLIPVRCQPRDARHIMYHLNAYALWLIRVLIWGCPCIRARSQHKGGRERSAAASRYLSSCCCRDSVVQPLLRVRVYVWSCRCVRTRLSTYFMILPTCKLIESFQYCPMAIFKCLWNSVFGGRAECSNEMWEMCDFIILCSHNRLTLRLQPALENASLESSSCHCEIPYG